MKGKHPADEIAALPPSVDVFHVEPLLVPGLDAEPVSYTHLRAHETVLDLVCRLLLEKKKQNISHTSNVPTTTIQTSTLLSHVINEQDLSIDEIQ